MARSHGRGVSIRHGKWHPRAVTRTVLPSIRQRSLAHARLAEALTPAEITERGRGRKKERGRRVSTERSRESRHKKNKNPTQTMNS